MLEDEILQDFLNNAVRKARKQIEEEGVLTVENAIPLLLRAQFNHILHLDEELTELRKVMDEKFERVEGRFERMEERFVRVFTFLGIGFGVIAALVTIFKFV